MDVDHAVERFWQQARSERPEIPGDVPDTWAFGATREQADELMNLVLTGAKNGTTASLWDHEHDGDPIAKPGDLSIVLDGGGTPRLLIRTTYVEVVPFHEVSAEHAAAEGEGDRSLASWRQVHRRFWEQHSTDPRGFAPDMPVVCERFEVLWAPPDDRRDA